MAQRVTPALLLLLLGAIGGATATVHGLAHGGGKGGAGKHSDDIVDCPKQPTIDVTSSAGWPASLGDTSATLRLVGAGPFVLPAEVSIGAGVTLCVVGSSAPTTELQAAPGAGVMFAVAGGALGLRNVVLRPNGGGVSNTTDGVLVTRGRLDTKRVAFDGLANCLLANATTSAAFSLALSDSAFTRCTLYCTRISNTGGGGGATAAVTIGGAARWSHCDSVKVSKAALYVDGRVALKFKESGRAEFVDNGGGAERDAGGLPLNAGLVQLNPGVTLDCRAHLLFARNFQRAFGGLRLEGVRAEFFKPVAFVDNNVSISWSGLYVNSDSDVVFHESVDFINNRCGGLIGPAAIDESNVAFRGPVRLHKNSDNGLGEMLGALSVASADVSFLNDVAVTGNHGNVGALYAQKQGLRPCSVSFGSGGGKKQGPPSSVVIDGNVGRAGSLRGFAGAFFRDGAVASVGRDVRLQITNNVGDLAGALLAVTDAAVRIDAKEVLIAGNRVTAHDGEGGGLDASVRSTITFGGGSRLALRGNHAAFGAGAVADLNSSIIFEDGAVVCVSGNSALVSGGAFYLSSHSSARFSARGQQSLSGNTAPTGPALQVERGSSFTCGASGLTRGDGSYAIDGPVCAPGCTGQVCSCPNSSGADSKSSFCGCAGKPLVSDVHDAFFAAAAAKPPSSTATGTSGAASSQQQQQQPLPQRRGVQQPYAVKPTTSTVAQRPTSSSGSPSG